MPDLGELMFLLYVGAPFLALAYVLVMVLWEAGRWLWRKARRNA